MRVFLGDVGQFLARDVVVEVVILIAGGVVVGSDGCRQLDEFTVGFGLHYSMDIAVRCIVPYALCGEIHSEAMIRSLVMRKSMRGVISATTDIAADEADPQVLVRAADGAFVQACGFAKRCAFAWTVVILGVAADGASGAAPFLEARAVEDVLAEDGEEAGGFVHAFEAHGAGGEFDEGGRRGRLGFRVARCRG